jgi:putative endonuclease
VSFRRTPESSKEKMPKQPTVYIMASEKNGTLYTGVTSNLIKRVWEHKNDAIPGFTQRYGVHTLVWFELHPTMESAIRREKSIKGWKRKWKLDLIEKENQNWHDLYDSITGLESDSLSRTAIRGRNDG